MKMTLYLTDTNHRLLEAMVDLVKADHPQLGKRGPLINQAVFNYATQLIARHLKDHGASPRLKARLKDLAKALEQHSDQP